MIKFYNFGRDAPTTETKPKKVWSKEKRAEYNKAYKAKLKALMEIERGIELQEALTAVESKRRCRTCGAPTHATSYYYCYRHHINTSDKNND